MPILVLDAVSLSFGHVPLLERADLRIEPGERIALIGRNGSGKSSLLKIISGDISPDAGSIWRAPSLRVARLEQEVAAYTGQAASPSNSGTESVFDEVARGLETLGELVTAYHRAAMEVAEGGGLPALTRLGDLQHQLEEEGGWRLEQKVENVVSRLNLPAERTMRELSGGWRRRVLLGKALVSEPDLLLLDEPTNHLDIGAIQWLENYLSGSGGALLFVTHDRAFLGNLATRIVELDRGRLTSWPGSYGRYLEKKAEALNAEALELQRLDRKLEKEEAWLRQGVKARRTRNEGRVRDLMELRKRRAAYRAESGVVRMSVDAAEASGRLVFEAEHVSKSFVAGVPIIRDYSQRILRGDRIGLIGPNGSGKSTLLRLLVGELTPDSGTIRRGARVEVAYFDQQREQLDPDRTVADTVNDGNDTVVINGSSRHVIGYLADFLFPRERAVSPVRQLSGGERNRLMLARLFARSANVLVMDEPTNDLDIETLDLLEEVINDFEGTILLVSHDRVFIEHIVTSTLAFEGEGRVTEYAGGYEDYLRQSESVIVPSLGSGRPELDEGRDLPPSNSGQSSGSSASRSSGSGAARTGVPDPESRFRKKLTFNESRELEALPARIESLESERSRLQTEAGSPDFYKEPAEHIRAVLARIDAIVPELDAALARWMELEERR